VARWLGGAERDQLGLRGVQVVDPEVEVGLLRHRWLRPGGSLVSVDADEGDTWLTGMPERDEIVAAVEHGQVEQAAVKPGQLAGSAQSKLTAP
jgi:hypothetical protein